MNPLTAKEHAWGGCGGAVHQRGRIFLAAQVELRGLVCHFVKNAVRHYTLYTSVCCHFPLLYLPASPLRRRTGTTYRALHQRGRSWAVMELSFSVAI